MIGRLLAAIRSARVAHYHRKANAAGAATLAAQHRRDWFAAADHMRDMHAAQAKRDRLISKQRRQYRCGRCHTVFFEPQECDWCPGSVAR